MSTLIQLQADTVRDSLYKAPFAVRHGLSGHPLFTLDRLVRLAQSMDRDRIEYNAGRLAPDQRPEDTPGIDLPAVEVIRRIETCGAWMAIKNVELDPDYRALLEGCLADIRAAQDADAEPAEDIRGFIFVSSAGSVTPFHVDPEQNILVQISGDKVVRIFDNEDRSLVSEEDMEMSPDKHRNQRYSESFEARARAFRLGEGDGVHIPYLWPHWVEAGESHSISLAITWKTPSVIRANKIRFMNGALRRLGLPQAAPGRHPWLDGAKVFAYDAMRAGLEPFRRSESLRRLLRRVLFGRKANYYYGS